MMPRLNGENFCIRPRHVLGFRSYGWRVCPGTTVVMETLGSLDALIDDVAVAGGRISAGEPVQQR